jgi:hypothetical protein
MLRPVKPLGGFSAYSPARFFETGKKPPVSKNRAAAGRLQTGFLKLTFATPKPLVLLALKTVAKLTLCAIGGEKGGDLFLQCVINSLCASIMRIRLYKYTRGPFF